VPSLIFRNKDQGWKNMLECCGLKVFILNLGLYCPRFIDAGELYYDISSVGEFVFEYKSE